MTIADEGTAMVEASSRDAVPAGQAHQITVCICTLRRPQLLSQTLTKLEGQKTDGLFTYSIVVADNDGLQSAQRAVAAFSSVTRLPVTYCVEPQQNIALARNKALQNAGGDLIAFIDDDEFPADDWLCELFKMYKASEADGVLGPVKPYFETEPPQWVRKGRFFERPTHPTGYRLGWEESRTGNVLFRKNILSGLDTPFRSMFGTAGEDMDFFRRAMNKGCSFVWCNEAVAYEVVPPSRCTRSYLLNRALLRGSNFPKHPEHRVLNVAKSLIAVPCYALVLPILSLFGQHVFLKYLIKVLDHASRLFAFLGLSLATQRQT
jgi:succinoglycan biosynthesis protein ExoM